MKKNNEIFIKDAKKVHGDRYIYLNDVLYKNNRTKMHIVCPEHGDFYQDYKHHVTRKQMCPKCSDKKKNLKSIERAKEKFYREIGKIYDLEKFIYINSSTKGIAICHEKDFNGNEHGKFEMTPNALLNGERCPKCSFNYRDLESFVKYANYIHNFKYDYSDFVYIDNSTKGKIYCPIHGEFWKSPGNHTNSFHPQGCPSCAKIDFGVKLRLSNDEFLIRSKAIHNDAYEYLDNYISYETKMKIKCKKCGNVFYQTPDNHLHNHGCPFCTKSKMENIVETLLEKNKIKFTREKTFDWLVYKRNMKLDFYLDDYGIAIECQGIQHFEEVPYFGKLEERIKRDSLKKELCEKHNIPIFYISYNDDIIQIFNNVIFFLKK